MTNSPTPGNESQPRTRSSRRRTLAKVAIGVSAIAFVGGVIGARQAWIFINRDLAPLIEQNLSQTLNRPVNLGAVEGVSFTGLSFGASTLPPTATDQDQVTLEAVRVRFNLLELIGTRTLRLSLTLVKPNIYLDQEKDGAWIKTKIQSRESEGFIKTELDVIRVQDAIVVLSPAPQLTTESGEPAGFEDPAKRPRVTLQGLNGTANFRENNQRISFDLAGVLLTGGDLRVRGESHLPTRATNLIVQGQNLLAPDISSLLPLPLGLEAGRLAANLEVRIRQDEPLAFNGTARFQDTIATIANVPNRFTEANGQLRFQEQTITLDNVRARYGLIPARASGSIHTQNGYNLAAQVRSVSITNLVKTFDIPLPISANGALDADLKLTGALNEPLITGTASNDGTIRVDRVNLSRVRTNFSVTPKYLAFQQLEATPAEGGQITGGGRLTFGDQGGLAFAFQGRNLPGDAIARPYGLNSSSVRLGRLAADVEVTGPVSDFQAVVRWRAPEATYPGQGDILLSRNEIRLENTNLQVAGGTVTATARSSEGRWQALVNASQVRLSQFSQDLRGLFSGNLRLSGRLDALNPRGVRAEGQVRFSEGIAIVDRPTTASIQWTGERLLVRQATAPGFSANGYILAQLQGQGAPAITGLNLNVNLQDYNVASLPIPVPPQYQLGGQADFNGRVTGTPAAPNVVGQLRLNDLAVNDLAFEPLLTGSFQYAGGQNLNLNVAGAQDQLIVRLDGRNRPTYFLVRQDEIFAEGRGTGDRLLATVQNFPLEALNISPAAQQGLGEVAGRLNGSFDVNLANLSNPSVVGDVAIARPTLGYIAADSFTGQFRYANGTAVLDNGELRRAESRYLISGTFSQGATPSFEGQINADQGRVEDILTAFQWFELQDFGRGIATPTYNTAADVRAIAIDTFGDSILDQLRRYSEIVALLDQQEAEQEQASFLPDLEDLKGSFSGTVNVASSAQAGLTADFSLLGQNWTWDQYGVNQVIAEGNLESGVVTLLPFRLQGLTYLGEAPENPEEEAFLAFSGQIGGAQQSGQLRVQNIPAEALRDLFRLPINLEGDLDATATLAGSQQNPEVVGEIDLVDASLNNTQVQEARTIFGYSNARLNFDGRVVIAEPQPLTISGSIPYLFPFMDQSLNPGDQISLDVNVRDEGLALLNLLTRRQLTWGGGEGIVSLEVRGTTSQPLATGIATFKDARFSALALPEPLTDVNGTVRFNSDRIEVETLQGRFSNGQVLAQGMIPIFNPARGPSVSENDGTPSNTPLTISLNQLALNLKGIYSGGVNGQVVLTGTALAPRIGGGIELSHGRVLLPENSQPATTTASTTNNAEESITTPPQFNNLLLTLGNRVLITREPILNFVAAGDLTINGTLGDLRPNGRINLRSGQVNLFTTQFSLARGYDSTAVFTPERRLDPFIDVRLATSVIEVTRAPNQFQTATPFASSEIADTPITDFGSFQTVRIQASVRGPASEIFDNLELTSSPRRSENEILALLGGGFIDTLGRGDSTLAIANLAGSALLTSVQNAISNALGLSEFRLFPTTVTDEDSSASRLGLAAELGVDITGNLSASVLQVLTDDVPAQFNLRYRLSDEFLLRGSSNFSGDNRAVLEFETRF